MESLKIVRESLSELASVATSFGAQSEQVASTGKLLLDGLIAGRCVFTCGNGGSAADALHLAEELTGKYARKRKPLAAVCLAADATALTCIANDFGFEEVFARPLEALGKPGDLLVAFSTSGNSPNILAALSVARANGLTSILLSGGDGGKARVLASASILVPSRNTARIQELHTLVLHCWLEIIDGGILGADR